MGNMIFLIDQYEILLKKLVNFKWKSYQIQSQYKESDDWLLLLQREKKLKAIR